MKKLKLNLSPNLGEVLTKDELKHVFGGGSGSGSGSSPECDGCKGKSEHNSCCYYEGGKRKNGTCVHTPFSGTKLVCLVPLP